MLWINCDCIFSSWLRFVRSCGLIIFVSRLRFFFAVLIFFFVRSYARLRRTTLRKITTNVTTRFLNTSSIKQSTIDLSQTSGSQMEGGVPTKNFVTPVAADTQSTLRKLWFSSLQFLLWRLKVVQLFARQKSLPPWHLTGV